MIAKSKTLPLLVLSLWSPACGGGEAVGPVDKPPAPELARFVLAADPGPAVGVAAAKQQGAQARIVVTGRVHEVTKGFAVLKLMDTALHYCGEVDKSDACKTPWDYCCDPKEARVANSLLVELRGADGRPVATPALPELRLCDLAKVTGRLERDAHGNLLLVADGVFRVERPDLPAHVRWPQ